MTTPTAGVLVAVCYLLFDKDTRNRLRWSELKVHRGGEGSGGVGRGGEGWRGGVGRGRQEVGWFSCSIARAHAACAAHPSQAAVHSWRRGNSGEVSDYNVQQKVYHRHSDSGIVRDSSRDPILPPYQE